MAEFSVGVIGTGPDPRNPTVESFAMGYRHAEAFENNADCDLVACADVVRENAEAFAETFDLDAENVFEDYQAMLDAVEPDVVSIAVPPHIHADIVTGCAEHGAVSAIHCEKPMADTLAAARRMVDVCDEEGVQLTFNRQRRFGRVFTEAKRLLDDGAIGDLERIEIGWGDFYDTGAHTVDLAGMFNDEHAAEWVIAQLDYREEDRRFGVHQENQMWAQWRYENGVHGAISTGIGNGYVGAAMALRGSDGDILIDEEGPMLVVRSGGERESVDVDGENIHTTGDRGDRYGSYFHDRAVDEVIESLQTGRQSTLDAHLGLNTAEIIFAGYESVRRRARVDVPADVEGNPLEEMVEAGTLAPRPTAGADAD